MSGFMQFRLLIATRLPSLPALATRKRFCVIAVSQYSWLPPAAAEGMPRRLQVFDAPVFDVRRQLARMAGTCAKRIELRTTSPERRRAPTTVRGICAFTIYVFFTPSTPR